MDYSFKDIINHCTANDTLDLITAVGYLTIKKEIDLETTEYTSNYEWIKIAMSITMLEHSDIMLKYERIKYMFNILKSNNWTYP